MALVIVSAIVTDQKLVLLGRSFPPVSETRFFEKTWFLKLIKPAGNFRQCVLGFLKKPGFSHPGFYPQVSRNIEKRP